MHEKCGCLKCVFARDMLASFTYMPAWPAFVPIGRGSRIVDHTNSGRSSTADPWIERLRPLTDGSSFSTDYALAYIGASSTPSNVARVQIALPALGFAYDAQSCTWALKPSADPWIERLQKSTSQNGRIGLQWAYERMGVLLPATDRIRDRMLAALRAAGYVHAPQPGSSAEWLRVRQSATQPFAVHCVDPSCACPAGRAAWAVENAAKRKRVNDPKGLGDAAKLREERDQALARASVADQDATRIEANAQRLLKPRRLKVYLASAWGSAEHMQRRAFKFRDNGDTVVSTWHDMGLVIEPLGNERAALETNLAQIRACDVLVIEPTTASRETYAEVFYAYQIGKPMIWFADMLPTLSARAGGAVHCRTDDEVTRALDALRTR